MSSRKKNSEGVELVDTKIQRETTPGSVAFGDVCSACRQSVAPLTDPPTAI